MLLNEKDSWVSEFFKIYQTEQCTQYQVLYSCHEKSATDEEGPRGRNNILFIDLNATEIVQQSLKVDSVMWQWASITLCEDGLK